MRVWRTNHQLLGQGANAPSGWVAGDLIPSPSKPGTWLIRNDDQTIFSVGSDGQENNLPAGSDTVYAQGYLPESRTQLAFVATGAVYGIILFP
jgi:hypothetical protein